MALRHAELSKNARLGMVRVGGLRGALVLLDELGVDSSPLIAGCGLPAEIFSNHDNEIRLAAAARFLDRCAQSTDIPHFGLLAGARNDLSSLGLLGHLAQSAATVGSAIDDLINRMSAHDRGAQTAKSVEGEQVWLTYLIDHPSMLGADHLNDGAIATIAGIMRELCGDDWRPTFVRLPKRRPRDCRPYVEFFKAEIAFHSNVAALSFPASRLYDPLPGANPSLHDYLDKLAAQAMRRAGSHAEDVRRIIRMQLFGGKPSIDRAAAMLGMHRRTLARRLLAEDVAFRALVRDVRLEIADELLTKTEAPISKIAALLGYSDQAAFSRAFVKRRGRPPSAVRNDSSGGN